MADDKPTLTRRRVLGGMATIGAAGAVGAGTWATFTDTENKQVTLTAGTLDLTVDGYNGETVYVEGGPLKNGGVFKDCETLENIGTIAGDAITVKLTNVRDYENGREEPELDANDPSGGDPGGPDSGELSEYLDIKGVLTCDNDEMPCTPGASSGTGGYIDLLAAEGGSITVDHLDMAPGDTCTLCFYVSLNEDAPNANDAMGDSVEFDLEITLEQKRSSGGTITPNGDDNNGNGNGDGNNGHGNNPGNTDPSNPGQGGGSHGS